MYRMQVFAKTADGKETILTPLEIQEQLKEIVKDADAIASGSQDPVQNPGVFTTAPRTTWSNVCTHSLLNLIAYRLFPEQLTVVSFKFPDAGAFLFERIR